MAKEKITDVVERELAQFLPEHGYELYLTEYLKEGKDWYLKVFVDKPEGGITVDDCEVVSRWLSDRLDEKNIIEKNYYLMVSSPGLDRPLVKDEHFEKSKGKLVDITLYKPLEGSKEWTGELKGLEDGEIVITDDSGREIRIPRDAASKVRLAVVF